MHQWQSSEKRSGCKKQPLARGNLAATKAPEPPRHPSLLAVRTLAAFLTLLFCLIFFQAHTVFAQTTDALAQAIDTLASTRTNIAARTNIALQATNVPPRSNITAAATSIAVRTNVAARIIPPAETDVVVPPATTLAPVATNALARSTNVAAQTTTNVLARVTNIAAQVVAAAPARTTNALIQTATNVLTRATNALVKASSNVLARATNVAPQTAAATTPARTTNAPAQAAPAVAPAKSGPNVIPSVTLNGVSYSNVLIESASATTITFAHSRGVASVNPDKLTTTELRILGLVEPEPPPRTNVFAKLPAALGSLTNRAEIEKALDRDRLKRVVTEPGGLEAYFAETGISWKAAVGITVGIYLFICLCLHKICKKAGRPSALVWLPFLQIFALYRAAKMPPFWFALLVLDVSVRLIIVMFVPFEDISKLPQFVVWGGLGWMILFTLIHVLGWIIWCFKICMVRGKSPAMGIFLLLPGAQVFVVLYLAFSK